MLDVAPTELLLLAVVALVVIGPKDLPKVMRVVGQWVGRARGMARHFRSGIDEMIRQSELEEMEKKWREENERIMREFPTLSGPNSLPDFRTPDIEAPAALPAPEEAAAAEVAPAAAEASTTSPDLAHWQAAATPGGPAAPASAATPPEEQLSLLPPDPQDSTRDGKPQLP